jgi:phage tail-like protein
MAASPFDAFARPRDPHERYLVEYQSIAIAVFKEAEGLDVARDTLDIEEGGREDLVAVTGPYSKGSFILREGESEDLELFRWFEKSRDADHLASSRRSGAVILVDGAGRERMRWKFRAGVITHWEGPADPPRPGRVYAVEALEVAHEGLEPVVRF